MVSVEPVFEIGEIVFLITDEDQSERMITGYIVRPGLIIYFVSKGTAETTHYEIEIASQKNWKK